MADAPANRRLAAVLAADVVGYSRMMGADEVGTLAALKQHRQALLNPLVAVHRGRVFKEIGDGTLVEFGSVVDAVRCALAIQRTVQAKSPASANGIVLRIGINLGDVIIDGDDIYGDGVNVAARLEPLAAPGGICIAGIVKESLGNRIDVHFRDGGEVAVKNIARPIRIWRWHAETEAAAADGDRTAPAVALTGTAPPSIAVLPFTNMSGNAEQDYFSDGITEDLITDLSKVGGLMVISRNSSFVYKNKTFDIRTVGRELGVTTVLEGSVRRAGNRVRITAQLIDAATGGHVWAERYDRDLNDIFAVQDDVTRQIVTALKVKLTKAEAQRIADATKGNLDAHDLFLRGRALFAPNMDGKSFAAVIDFFERAVALDPNFGEAYALGAAAHMLNFVNRWSEEPDASLGIAETLSAKAIAAGPGEPNGHLTGAWVSLIRRDYERARTLTDRALRLDPNSAFALNSRATLAIYLGHPEEAVPHLERAMQLDPAVSQQYLHFLGIAHLLMGHDETAAAVFRERILLTPETDFSRSMLASALGHLGQLDEARRVWAEIRRINPRYSFAEHIGRMPFKDPATADRIANGLAKAGLPD